MNERSYSVGELANVVNEWCGQRDIAPLDSRSGAEVSVRNIRYYQSLGLVDRPVSADGRGFAEKHRLQLIAIRILQAKGLPLAHIHSLLYGRTEQELREVERRGLKELERFKPVASAFTENDWKVTPIGEDILILNRTGRELTAAQKLKIQQILEDALKPQLN
jgi:DNA-binding transcriptional MerR regulator